MAFRDHGWVTGRNIGLPSLLLCVAGLLALALPAHAAFPGMNGKIAFSTSRDSQPGQFVSRIYTMDPDGTNQLLLTAGEGIASGGQWSPDGMRLVFNCAFEQQEFVICTINADGTGLTRLTAGGNPTWAPDGKKITFQRASDIFVMNADGSGQTNLTNDLAFPRDFGPVWSPDGNKIAFTSSRSNDVGFPIYLMNPDGTGITRVTSPRPGRADVASDWSPDGSRIAFASSRDGPQDVYSINADGTGLARLTMSLDGYFSESPAWSPDGQQIAFGSDRGDPDPNDEFPLSSVYAMNSDGSNVVRLTNIPGAFEGSPTWQPIPAPQRGDYKNAAHFCKAERDFVGDAAFRQRYGGGANAHGICVSGK